jgi:hypothetical protein
MSLTKSLFALVLVVQTIIIISLLFQIRSTACKYSDNLLREQDQVTKAARLIVQSATQSHPLFAHDHAIEAKIIIDEIINSNNGVVAAENNLKLTFGKLETLRSQIYEQYKDVQSYIMEHVIDKDARFDTELNEAAGLQRSRRKPKKLRHRPRHKKDSESDS